VRICRDAFLLRLKRRMRLVAGLNNGSAIKHKNVVTANDISNGIGMDATSLDASTREVTG